MATVHTARHKRKQLCAWNHGDHTTGCGLLFVLIRFYEAWGDNLFIKSCIMRWQVVTSFAQYEIRKKTNSKQNNNYLCSKLKGLFPQWSTPAAKPIESWHSAWLLHLQCCIWAMLMPVTAWWQLISAAIALWRPK